MKKFTTHQLVFIALMAAIMFAFDFVFVAGIDAALGIPGIGVLFDTIIIVGTATILGLVIRRFWVITIAATLYTILAIPTNLFGPPGAYKIVLGLFLGFIVDLVLYGFSYSKFSYYLSFTLGNVASLPLLLVMLQGLGLPGADELAKVIWMVLPIVLLESPFGVWVGWKVYDRVKKNHTLKQVQG